jgi:hypothetical protein
MRNVLAITGVLAGVAASTQLWGEVSELAAEGCTSLSNGSFDDGLAGWNIVPEESSTGDAFTSFSTAIVDASGYSPAFDTQVLQMTVDAAAGLSGGTGSTQGELRLVRNVTVASPVLRFTLGGGFEFQFTGQGGRSLSLTIDVEGPGGHTLTHVVYDSGAVEPLKTCFPSLSVLGTFDHQPPIVEIDFTGTAIQVGDKVDIVLRLEATAGAIHPCQFTVTSAFLLLDEFQWCGDPRGEVPASVREPQLGVPEPSWRD